MAASRRSMPGSWLRDATSTLSLGVVLAVPSVAGEGTPRGPFDHRRVAPAAEVAVVRDVSYGADPKQRFDVYAPNGARNAPVILMVHGGGWRIGDKRSRGVVENKVARWTRAGIIVISVNYRMLPGTDPVEQARDVARALAAAQGRMSEWGGDPGRVVLMGHSAGAHLVALLDANPALATRLGARGWLGTVILDSAALDIVQTMERPHAALYDAAFGTDRAYWREASPHHHLAAGAKPVLIVCSSRRSDSCPAARRFAAKATSLGVRAEVQPVAKSHAAIDAQLGLAGEYTEGVEAFLASLDPSLDRALEGR
jgi:arylformamidase